MENPIIASTFNDFLFCPYSIMIHGMYEDMPKKVYKSEKQINGTYLHMECEIKGSENDSCGNEDILVEEKFYSNTYNIVAVIDFYDKNRKQLIEKKAHITEIYPGQIFQLYAQYYALIDNGYEVETLGLYSIIDEKMYNILLPENDNGMLDLFKKTIKDMKELDISSFFQTNKKKCINCIYSNLCDRSLDD